jgi:hypothetical protein
MDDLTKALVAAVRPHVVSRVTALAPGPVAGLDDAVSEAETWLESELKSLLSLPFDDQRRSPLELFQEAMRFPTEALRSANVVPIRRDPVEAGALPGDLYRLAPASSQELGEEVWRAHLAWGAGKAKAMVRPGIGLFSSDLMDRSRVEGPVAAAGFDLVVWSSIDRLLDAARYPVVAFVDLAHDGSDEAVRRLAGVGVRVVGFGPHVDDLAMVRARSLGAADALPRSRFFSRLTDLFPTLT